MKIFTTAFALIASVLLVASVTVADPIGGVNDAAVFCDAPTGGAQTVADADCGSCGCKGDKAKEKGSCGCDDEKKSNTESEVDDSKDSKTSTSCNENQHEAALDEFLGGLARVDYACGCID